MMMTPPTMPRPIHELRIASLVVAPLLAAVATLSPRNERVLHAAAPALVVLWMVMAAALVLRLDLESRLESRRPDRVSRTSLWAQLDVLTTTGSSVMWTAVAALVLAGLTGWASLGVIGVLGLAAVYVAATWTTLIAGGDVPWRRATIARTIVPAIAVEGDELREEVRLTGVKIPAGMRLFATGHAMRHGVITRYAVGSDGSLADLKLESELGSAMRGEHQAPPLRLWLGDVLGLTRTPFVERGEASFVVQPRVAVVRGARELLGAGGDDQDSRPARQPTDGTFRIRSYVPGDDARRIHWVRTLQLDELVVRLPDEIPTAEPEVRLILDSDLWGAGALSCRAPDELLDALVRVWLGVGKALAQAGTRVTLVAVADHEGTTVAVERPMVVRAPREALRLGGRVSWQNSVPLASLIGTRRSPTQPGRAHGVKQIVVSSRPRRVALPSPITWVVVPEIGWTSPEPWSSVRSTFSTRLPFPSGSADNRLGRRLRERRRISAMWHDRTIFSQVMCWTDWTTFSGDYVARPHHDHVSLAVIP
jgi:uncharacterized protein (DUF58 family)